MTSYHGDSLSVRDYELRAMKIHPMHRELEPDLVHSRWFDYATLKAAQATYLYADLYRKQTLIFNQSFIDLTTATDARAFTPDDIFMSRDMTSMWLARGAADALCMPYTYALSFAQNRALERHFKSFPRPNQLYGEEFTIDLEADWKDTLSRSLQFSRLPAFQAVNYVGSWNQKRHLAFVVKQVNSRPKPHHSLLARLMNEGIFNANLAQVFFDEEVVRLAIEGARELAVSHT